MWVNSVGPYHNPQETYPYYHLPYCKPSHGIETRRRPSGIGEILEGNELRNSGLKLVFPGMLTLRLTLPYTCVEYDIFALENVDKEDVCDLKMTKEIAAEFELAIERQYWYQHLFP